jgi:polyhydroxyalkanoate synthesis regulator phasin
MRSIKRYAVPAAGIAALAAGAIAVQAASPAPSGAENPAQIFVDKLAGILHVSSSQARTDLQQAELQTIDQMVKDGRLTQAQADALKQRIQNGQGLGFGFGPGFFGRPPKLGGLMQSLMTAEVDAAASTLKLSPAQLKSDLGSGKTIAQLEQSAGVTDATLRAALVKAARGVLDPAVKAGTITQAEENQVLQRIQNAGFGFFGGHRPGPWGGHRGAPPGAAPSSLQQS